MDLSGRTLGEFTLREPIGEGGYGTVYRAEQPALEREVVVKVLREERGSPDARERFLREARLAAQLRHPYAAQVYASGAADGGSLLWIAMEQVQGVSLGGWLEKNGRMPLEQFVPFFGRVCEVVHAAHERGILHRDLKPSNIMVVECGNRLVPKLLDLGIARESWTRRSEIVPDAEDDPGAGEHRDADGADGDHDTDRDGDTDPFGARTDRMPVRPLRAGRKVAHYHSSQTRRRLTPPNATLGSSAYMAPDLWGGADLAGPEADVYALGIVAYETLTGCLPFVADRAEGYYELHEHAPVPPLGDGFPPGLDVAIQRALAKSPRARTRDALELARDLQKALRTSRREQLRTSAQQWLDERCPPGLLWGADVVGETLRRVPGETLGSLERLFLEDSQRRIRRARSLRRALVALAALVVVGGLLYRAATQARQARLETQLVQEQTRSARQVMEATVTQAELDQGRSALLHDEPEAAVHLGRAYQRGERSPSTAFMLARALQPRLAEQARLASTAGRMWSAAFSPDGRQIVTTDDRGAQVWDAQTYRRTLVLFHGAAVYGAAYSPDGTRVVTAGGDGTVKIDGSLLITHDGGSRLALPASSGSVDAVSLLPDGRVVAADAQRRLRVYDSDGGALADLEVPARLASLHLRGPRLVAVPVAPPIAASATSPVLVDLEHYRVVAQLEGHIGSVYSTRWVAEDQILSAGADGKVRLWDGVTGRLRQVYQGGSRILTDATLSPDGLVMAGGSDGMLQFWDRDGRLLWMLRAHAGPIVGIHIEGGDIVTREITGELARWTLPRPGRVIEACGERERCAILLP